MIKLNAQSFPKLGAAPESRENAHDCSPLEKGRLLWRGFTQPSSFAFSLMVVTLCMTVAVLLYSVTPERLSVQLGQYLPYASDDADGFATQEAYRLAYGTNKRPGTPIYIPGNSIMAQALADDLKLRHALERRTHRPWNVTILTTPLQSALDETALLDYATRKRPGVVVLSISADRFSADSAFFMKQYRYGRLGFRSSEADRQVSNILKGEIRRQTGVFLLDNRSFFMVNASMMAARWLLQRPAIRKIDIYLDPQTPQSQARLTAEALKAIRRRHDQTDISTRVLADTVRFVKARGNKIVFFDVPPAPWVLKRPEDRSRYNRHTEEAERLSVKLGGTYCGLNEAERPPASAYWDPYHIKDPVWQKRLRARLSECVGRL